MATPPSFPSGRMTTQPLASGIARGQQMLMHGATAQQERFRIITENLANSGTTSNQPGGKPYQRQIAKFKQHKDHKQGITKVQVQGTIKDKKPFRMEFDPGHPAADETGTVLYPNVHKETELADAMDTQRSMEMQFKIYEAGTSLQRAVIDMMR